MNNCLSSAHWWITSTTVNVNGTDYALFGGGSGTTDVDVIGFDVMKNDSGV